MLARSTMKLLPQILLGISILVIPLVFDPTAALMFELPRVFALRLFAMVWISLVALGLVRYQENILLHKRSLLIASIFGGWIVFTALTGENLARSVWGNYYRADGLATLLSLLVWVSVPWSVPISWSKRWLPLAWLLSAFLICLIAWSEKITGTFWGYHSGKWSEAALGATFGQPNFLAGFLVMVLPWSFYLIVTSSQVLMKLLWSFLCSLLLLTLILTQSWGGLVAVVVAWLVWWILSLDLKPIKLSILIGTFFISSCAGTYWYLERMPVDIPDSRARIFQQTLTGWSQRPFLGWGWANIDAAFESNDNWPVFWVSDIYVDKAHAHLIEILTATGIIGLCLYAVFWTSLCSHLYPMAAIDPWKRCLLTIIIVYLVHSQTNVIGITQEWLMALTVGLSLRQSEV